jgi:hypothetical protein
MNKIKFIHNWNNKLDNNKKVWTTIRKATPSKYEYYSGLVDEDFQVILNGKIHSKAVLRYVEVMPFEHVPLGLLLTDTGATEAASAISVFKNFGINNKDEVLILTFAREAGNESL